MLDVSRVEVATCDASDLAAMHAIDEAVELDTGTPEALIPPLEQYALDLRHPPEHARVHHFVARSAGVAVGRASCEWEDVASNRDQARVFVVVDPRRRGEGCEDALLRELIASARGFGCRVLTTEAPTRGADARWLPSRGFECRLRTPRSACWTRDLDSSLMETWVSGAAERGGDYTLVTVEGRCPDDLIDGFVDLWHVMNTAPMEQLDWEEEVMTPERWRAIEASYDARELDQRMVIARHEPSGVLAGFTGVTFPRRWSTYAEQQDTGVRPEHRNRGLGRWLKGAMALHILDERPEVEVIETWNAGSNRPMLAINHEMGFASIAEWGEWQGDLDRIESTLG